jgi:hypothetical protein
LNGIVFPVSQTSKDLVCEAGYQMKTRILFSMALVAVLFGFWLIMSKPACLADEAASLGPRLQWTCLPR